VECNSLRQSINGAISMLETALAEMNEQKLEAALNYCYDKKNFKGQKYRCDLEAKARDLLKKIKHINKEAIRAMRECEEHHVRAVVAEAAEINLHNADIDSLTRLVKGSYDRFLAEQFKKAKRCKHHSRAIRVALKQKSREFNKSNTNLRMSDFSLLKQPMAWTKERFHWGSDTTRAANMLKFQEAHLHSPLTTSLFGNTDKLYVKLVTARILATFDTVQKAMGQRNTRNMDLRLYELVRDGLEYPEVRDECYLHLFKQLQDNKMIAQGRGTEQTANAFEMLAFCLCVFPPSESLEPYLEQWIRESSNKVYSEQYNLPGLLRRRMYFGPLKMGEAPTQTEFAMECRYAGKVYGSGALGPVLSARLKLKEFKETKKASSSGESSRASSPSKGGKKDKKKKSAGKKSTTETPWQTGVAVTEQESQSPWKATVDPGSGKTYYFNTQTQAVQWDMPAEGCSEC